MSGFKNGSKSEHFNNNTLTGILTPHLYTQYVTQLIQSFASILLTEGMTLFINVGKLSNLLRQNLQISF